MKQGKMSGSFANMPQESRRSSYPKPGKSDYGALNDKMSGIDEVNARSERTKRSNVSYQK